MSNNVKLTHLLTLLQEGYTTIDVTLPGGKAFGTYTYKSSIKDLAVGDLVVVPTGSDFKVGRVHKVDESPQIDVNAPYALKWAVCRVDLAEYEQQAANEEAALKRLGDEQRKRAREEALKTLLGDVNVDELRALLRGPKEES